MNFSVKLVAYLVLFSHKNKAKFANKCVQEEGKESMKKKYVLILAFTLLLALFAGEAATAASRVFPLEEMPHIPAEIGRDVTPMEFYYPEYDEEAMLGRLDEKMRMTLQKINEGGLSTLALGHHWVIPIPCSMQISPIYCVPACVQNILLGRGLGLVDQNVLAAEMGTAAPHGTYVAPLLNTLRTRTGANYEAANLNAVNLPHWFQADILAGYPTMVYVNYRSFAGLGEGPHIGHALTGHGFALGAYPFLLHDPFHPYSIWYTMADLNKWVDIFIF